MARNPVLTKEHIVKVAGVLFNTQGYKATSLSEITEASGYTKGAIYKHFDTKSDLELASLEYLCALVTDKITFEIKREKTAPEKLKAILRFYKSYGTNPIVNGGCPLLNAAIESDDANPVLRNVVQNVMQVIQQALVKILDNGIRYGQIKKDIDKEAIATLIIASFEGAIMMSQLYNDNKAIVQIAMHLENQIKSIEVEA